MERSGPSQLLNRNWTGGMMSKTMVKAKWHEITKETNEHDGLENTRYATIEKRRSTSHEG